MKRYLTCPKCREKLPQIGSEPIAAGDSVTCGLCGHDWTPIKKFADGGRLPKNRERLMPPPQSAGLWVNGPCAPCLPD